MLFVIILLENRVRFVRGNTNNKKMFYVFITCIVLSVLIIGGTFAYFTAFANDALTINGSAASVSFGLKNSKVTDVDNAFGLIPMKNDQAPNAALMKCRDDYGNAGCQIYKITVTSDSSTVMFLDGYVIITPKEGVETRFASVYREVLDGDEEVFKTRFTLDDFVNHNDLSSSYLENNSEVDTGIRDGSCELSSTQTYNHVDSSDCLFVTNEKIGGNIGNERVFYMMVWVYDNGSAQNHLQGMDLAYQGEVVFTTAEGNEITATFD